MDIRHIFSEKVDDLINEFEKSRGKHPDRFLDKAEKLAEEIKEAQKDIPYIAVDQREALYKLTGFINELKGNQLTMKN